MVLFLFFLGAGILVFRSVTKGVWVTGYDTHAGTKERRKFVGTNPEGGITWKKKEDDNIHVVLDREYRWQGKRGPEFDLDLTTGRLMRWNPDGDTLSMPGQRLWAALFGGALRQISDSARTNLENLLKIALVGGAVGLVIIGGILIYAVKLLQDSGVAGQ